MKKYLYKLIIKSLHLLQPELAHSIVMHFLNLKLFKLKKPPNYDNLKLKFCNIPLPNPIGLAAGFDKNGNVIPGLFSLGFGFIEIGAVTPHPQSGNKKPRLFRLKEDQGIINRLGFNNRGMIYVTNKLIEYKGNGKIGLNIGANKNSPDKIADFLSVLSYSPKAIDFITINVSSPNTEGLRKLQRKEDLIKLIKTIIQNDKIKFNKKPILLKIAPDLNDEELKSIVEICQKYKISGIVATNTTTRRPSLKSNYLKEPGGLSGKPLFHLSNNTLAKLYYLSEGKIPLIGVGGVFSGKDAYKKICLGASVVQLYTALIYKGPYVVKNILAELNEIIDTEGYKNISEVIGSKNHQYLMEETDRSILG